MSEPHTHDPRALLRELAESRFDAHGVVAEAQAREARAAAERHFAAGAAGTDAGAAHEAIARVLLLERLIPRARIAREHGDPLHRLLRDLQAASRAVNAAVAALHKPR